MSAGTADVPPKFMSNDRVKLKHLTSKERGELGLTSEIVGRVASVGIHPEDRESKRVTCQPGEVPVKVWFNGRKPCLIWVSSGRLEKVEDVLM